MEINSLEDYLTVVKKLGWNKLRMALQAERAEQAKAEVPQAERAEQVKAEVPQAERAEQAKAEVLQAEAEFQVKSAEFLEKAEFLPLEYLFQLLGCGSFERHCVLMALCGEMDARFMSGFSRLREVGQAEGLTPHIARLTWPEQPSDMEMRRAFHRNSVLMSIFFRRAAEEWYPEIGRPLTLTDRVLDFIFGHLEEDERLKPYMTRYQPEQEQGTLKGSQPDILDFLESRAALIELSGEPGVGKRFCVKHYCQRTGQMAYFISVERLLYEGAGREQLFEDIRRECCLFQAVPVLILSEETEDEEGQARRAALDLADILFEAAEPVFILNRKPISREGWRGTTDWLHFDVRDMSLMEKREVWKRESKAFRVCEGLPVEEMANLFPLTYGGILEALSGAAWRAKKQGREAISREDLQHGCRSLFQMNMKNKAISIPPVYTWEDLILPDYQKELLSAACDQVRYKHQVYEVWGFSETIVYGRGISMIFAGPPGTGKTMAAQVFAGELGIDLYKVELSAVVSKFVGETEKNLNLVFEQARKSRVILFFDEADVLFGKRTEVKDSNDKYSNMEAAFLLQKMEEYEGMTILATNLILNFDEAFKRRVKFVVDFPFPGPADRKRLWRKAMPPGMERDELDVDYLAGKFELSGSGIKNVVLHAAFLAAAAGRSVNMRHILLGIRNEYQKSGKALTKKELGEYYVLLPEVQS